MTSYSLAEIVKQGSHYAAKGSGLAITIVGASMAVAMGPKVIAGTALLAALNSNRRNLPQNNQGSNTFWSPRHKQYAAEVAMLTDNKDRRLDLDSLVQRIKDITTCMRSHVGNVGWELNQGIVLSKQVQADLESIPGAMRDRGMHLDIKQVHEEVSHLRQGLDRVFDKAATPEFAHSVALSSGQKNKSGLSDDDRLVWAARTADAYAKKGAYAMPTQMPGANFVDPQKWKGSSTYEGMSPSN